ncbi:MAG TPA: alpha/beta hydrolase, partial [Methylotenera sp.]|nr:alpha/beta hydrolase [Methylotenera sp.]
QWLSENAAKIGGDPTRLALGGDSAGGYFAAVLSQFNREKPMFDCTYQVLIYPCLDATMSLPSMESCGEGYGFTTEKMAWYWNHYLPADIDRTRFDVSPLLTDDFSDLPPAFIATAEYDPLRDDGEAYARGLEDAGVPVKLKRYRGMIHGFMQMAQAIDKGQTLIDEVGSVLRYVMFTEEV